MASQHQHVIPTRKLLNNLAKVVNDSRPKVVIISTGAYCPVHKMHLEVNQISESVPIGWSNFLTRFSRGLESSWRKITTSWWSQGNASPSSLPFFVLGPSYRFFFMLDKLPVQDNASIWGYHVQSSLAPVVETSHLTTVSLHQLYVSYTRWIRIAKTSG